MEANGFFAVAKRLAFRAMGIVFGMLLLSFVFVTMFLGLMFN